jgi:hypothetical protein
VSGVVEEYRGTHRIDRTFGASVNRLTRVARGTYQSQGGRLAVNNLYRVSSNLQVPIHTPRTRVRLCARMCN